ncbi:MAG: single-stranded-DNA-specific exonuclease RecJ [Gammaproteobacteria bacterium]
MNKKIVRRTPGGMDWQQLAAASDLHPVLARAYALRQVMMPQEVQYRLQHLMPVDQLKGQEEAVELLCRVLAADGHILVVGDFDADGATSCALVLRALRSMGGRVSYLVPNRFEYGYGLTPEIVAVAAARQPDLIVTVDNGISSVAGVAAAARRGIPVLVTDHHLPGAQLPPAAAIVNPNQPGDAFPSKHLAGVGVIFYLMMALRTRLRDNGWFSGRAMETPNLAALLDLVALGTVADVVPLDFNNRILVAQGLARIRRDHCCAGIRALLQVAGRERGAISAADLGYALGPRLNAAGRLQDMSLGIECLLCDDDGRALELARELDGLNRERRRIETQMKDEALTHLAQLGLAEDEALPRGLCLYHAQWHQGVVGILAARIKERLHRPVIVFARCGDGELKGSARSVPGLHIRDVLDEVAARHPQLIAKFGGHAMAAGLSLREDNYEAFCKAFDETVCGHLQEEDLQGLVISDGELAVGELNLDTAMALREGGPWGQAFPEPVFDGVFEVLDRRVVGEHHLKLRLAHPEGGPPLDAIAFNTGESACSGGRIHVAYRLDVNEYRGNRRPQLIVEHIAG